MSVEIAEGYLAVGGGEEDPDGMRFGEEVRAGLMTQADFRKSESGMIRRGGCGVRPCRRRVGPTGRTADHEGSALGARNLAAITPFYLPAGHAALVDYYRRLDAVAGKARIFVYLYAARSGTTVTPDQLAELAKIPSVSGAKMSGESTSAILRYVQAMPDDFEVYSGNGVEFGDFVRAGGTGGLSGVSGVFPRPFLDLADALRRDDEQAAGSAQDRVRQAVTAVGGADIALLKAALSLQGLPGGPTRVALDPPTPVQLATLRTAVQDLA